MRRLIAILVTVAALFAMPQQAVFAVTCSAEARAPEQQTGDGSVGGKARSARNALKHGGCMASALAELAECRRIVREMKAAEREIRRQVYG